ncbi:MAG: ECF transporter S component [Nanoarchaeota archaeon]
MKMQELTGASLLAALALVFQLSPFWPTHFGMRLDLVAVPWLICLFLFGFRAGMLSMTATCVVICFIGEASWLGALMKFSATLPSMLLLGLVLRYKKRTLLFFAAFAALAVRSVGMVFLNYFFALPLWLHKATAEIISNELTIAIIAMNALQGVIELLLAYGIVYHTKLRRHAKHLYSKKV